MIVTVFAFFHLLALVAGQGFLGLGNSPLKCLPTMYTSCTYVANKQNTKRDTGDASYVNCESSGSCTDETSPNGHTCCKRDGVQPCKSCIYKDCCDCSFLKPDKYCPISGWRASDYTGDKNKPPSSTPTSIPKSQLVTCNPDGTCAKTMKPTPWTCYGTCKSCTNNNFCHCKFTDPTEYCPIPGWRSPYYTGDLNKRRTLGNCGDPVDYSFELLLYAGYLLGIAVMRLNSVTQFYDQVTPYSMHNWTFVDGPNTARPLDGYVVVRQMEPDLQQRVEYMERIVRPQDLRTGRTGGFGTNTQWYRRLGARGGDEAGHILSWACGGPNRRFNCFPQDASVNHNLGGRWLMDSWINTEQRMRNFLSQGIPGGYIVFRAALIYDNDSSGRPVEIAWSAVFVDPARANGNDPGIIQFGQFASLGGRLRNTLATQAGPHGTCPSPR